MENKLTSLTLKILFKKILYKAKFSFKKQKRMRKERTEETKQFMKMLLSSTLSSKVVLYCMYLH